MAKTSLAEKLADIDIPNGVQRFIAASGDSEEPDQFGVVRMQQGKAEVLSEDHRNGMLVDGFRVFFRGIGEKIVVTLQREHIVADEINRIGKLCATTVYLWALHQIVHRIEDPTKHSVAILKSKERARAASAEVLQELNFDTTTDVVGTFEQVGLLLEKMQDAYNDIFQKIIAIYEELDSLGVARFVVGMERFDVKKHLMHWKRKKRNGTPVKTNGDAANA